jgi:hypothetical protein
MMSMLTCQKHLYMGRDLKQVKLEKNLGMKRRESIIYSL